MKDLGSLPLPDHYEAVLAEGGAAELRRRLGEIEARLWYGRSGERACLERELARAREEGAKRRATADVASPDLLILILGYSPDPLLLAVAHHAPADVIVLREHGLGADFIDRLRQLWDHYRSELGVAEFERVVNVPVHDDAAELYRTIERLVETRRATGTPRLVLDITGAKKTMVAGAFLAAGMLGLETTYVDFSGYDPVLRRPKPGASRVEAVVHPAALFRLRERQRLAEAFDGRRYVEAALLAEQLEETVRRSEVEEVLGRTESERQGHEYRALRDLASAYDAWRQGFYRDAEAALQDAGGVPVPPQIELLAGIWPESSADLETILGKLAESKIGKDPSAALAYFLDVLVWIDPAVAASRPRDGCLRLFGSIEAVASWAFEVLVVQEFDALEIEGLAPGALEETLAALQSVPEIEPEDRLKWLREAAVEVFRADPNAPTKLLGSTGGRDLDGARLLIDRKVRPNGEAPSGPLPLRAFLRHPPLAGEPYRTLQGRHRYSRLRNKAVHWLAPVPVPVADEMLDLYRRALRSIVPIVVARVKERAVQQRSGSHGRDLAHRTAEWARDVLAAADGSIPAPYHPLTLAQAREVLSAAAALGAVARA